MTETVSPQAFGMSADMGAHYRLRLGDNGCASLHHVADDGGESQVAAALWWWPKATDAVEADWNRRLAAKGHILGAMPKPVGVVDMHSQFGRELEVLMQAVSGLQEVRDGLKLWGEATPKWRAALYQEAVDWRNNRVGKTGRCASCVPQLLLELLRLRDRNGDRDLARENSVLAPRAAAMAEIIAVRSNQKRRQIADRKAAKR